MNDVIGHIPMNRYKHFLSYINTDNRIAPIVIIINMPYITVYFPGPSWP